MKSNREVAEKIAVQISESKSVTPFIDTVEIITAALDAKEKETWEAAAKVIEEYHMPIHTPGNASEDSSSVNKIKFKYAQNLAAILRTKSSQVGKERGGV